MLMLLMPIALIFIILCFQHQCKTDSNSVFIGDYAFGVAAAFVWNSLAPDVTKSTSLSVFKQRLKALL